MADWTCPGCGCGFLDLKNWLHLLTCSWVPPHGCKPDFRIGVACGKCWASADISTRLKYVKAVVDREGEPALWQPMAAAVWAEAGGSPGRME